MSKIDRWWIREIELDCNSEFNHVDRGSIPDSEITSGNMLLMQMVISRTFGDTNAASREYQDFLSQALKELEPAE